MISVLVPMYNAEKLVAESLRSILPQLSADDEVLVIDDASTDQSVSVVESLMDPRICILQQPENAGVAAALNLGLDRSKGDYLVRLDADDRCHPRRVNHQIEFMRNHKEVGVCGSWIRLFGRSRAAVEYRPLQPDCLHAFTLFDNPLHHPSVVLRGDTVRKHGFRYDGQGFSRSEDFDLWRRMAKVTSLANIPLPLMNVRLHPVSVTSTHAGEMERQTLQILREQLLHIGLDPSEGELRIHREIGHGFPVKSQNELHQVREWLSHLTEANHREGTFPEKSFQEAVGWVWYRVCRNSCRSTLYAGKAWLMGPQPLDFPFSLHRRFWAGWAASPVRFFT